MFEEVIAQNFPKIIKHMKSQITESPRNKNTYKNKTKQQQQNPLGMSY